MRIHEIEIENIASLRGKHHINFDYIGSQSSLFAITGKTGAGKSTILNSISLALYGDVYKKDSQSNDFVTLGESAGEINLSFSIGTQRYRAHWQMKIKKKNGEYLKKPQLVRTLFLQSGNELTATEKSIEEIINLNFNQFCKTSILNQGEFAKFLTSSFNERKSILEKFYDGINLELINLKLREKLRSNKEQLEEKQNLILGIKQAIKEITLTQEDIEKEEKITHKLHSIYEILDDLAPSLNDILKQYRLILSNHERKRDLIEKQQVSQKNYNKLKKENTNLQQKYDECEGLLKQRKPILDECLRKEFEYNKNQEQKVHFLEQKSNYLSEKESAAVKLKELVLKLSNLTENCETLTQKNNSLATLNIKNLSADISAYIALISKSDDLHSRSKKTQEKIALIEEKKLQLDAELAELEQQFKQISIENIDKKLEGLTHKSHGLTQLSHTLSDYIKEHQNLKIDLERVTQSLNEQSLELTKLASKISENNELIRFNQNTIKLFSLQLAIHQCQENSLTGGSCVVCGTDIRNLNLHVNPVQEKELTDAQSKLEQLEAELLKLKEKEQQHKIEMMSFKTEQNRVKDRMGDINARSLMEWNKFSELPLSQNILREDSLKPILRLLEDTEKKTSNLRDQKTKIQLDLQNIETLKEKRREISSQLSEMDLESKNLKSELSLTLKNIKDVKAKYSIDLQHDDLKAKEKLQNLLELGEEYEQLQAQIEQTKRDKVRQTEIQMHADTKAKEITSLIESIIFKNNELEKYIKDHSDKELSAADELKLIEENFESATKKLTQNKDELAQERIFMAEAKSKLENSEDQIRSATIMIKSHQKNLQEKMTSEHKAYFMDQEQFHSIPSLLDKFSKFDVQDLNLESIIQASIEQYEHFFARAKDLYQKAQNTLTTHQTLYQQKLDGENQIANIQADADLFLSEKNKLDNLYDLLGKDEFRNYILSIIESTLIEQTNKELNILCNGRYSLCQSNKTNRLITEFKIIDHYADGLVRKISTLSGGETFLVSLAMALALAELTRGQTQLDSLFIDEGFGTLDHETIDEVYELLLSIQHSGKQIGIISHVKELTGRIPININLEKNMSGSSQIEIVNN